MLLALMREDLVRDARKDPRYQMEKGRLRRRLLDEDLKVHG
jgi:hypothetical protein